jgi:hypothetical protein
MSLWRKRNVKHNEQKHDNLSNPLDRLHEENVRLGLYEGVYDLSIKSDDLSIKSSKGIEMSIEAMKVEGPLHVVCQCDKCKAEKQEPLEYWSAVEGWVKLDEVREHFDSVSCGTIYKNGGEGRVPLYTTPQQRTWVGLTYEDMVSLQKDLHDSKGEIVLPTTFAKAVEAKLKEKNT